MLCWKNKSLKMDYYSECEITLNLLHSYHAHAPGADINKYFDCFSPQGRFLGTDKNENWSIEDFRKYSEPFFNNKQAAPFVPLQGSRKFTSFPIISSTSTNKPIVVTFDEILECEGMKTQARGTGSLIWDEEKNKWLIFLYHLSIPVPNEIADQVCNLTRNVNR